MCYIEAMVASAESRKSVEGMKKLMIGRGYVFSERYHIPLPDDFRERESYSDLLPSCVPPTYMASEAKAARAGGKHAPGGADLLRGLDEADLLDLTFVQVREHIANTVHDIHFFFPF